MKSNSIGPLLWNVDMGSVCRSSKFVEGAGFELSNTFLGDSQFLANFFKRQWLEAMVQSKSADNNLLFALIESVKDFLDLIGTCSLIYFCRKVVGSFVFVSGENLFGARSESISMFEFIGNGSREVLYDGPRCIGAKLIAT